MRRIIVFVGIITQIAGIVEISNAALNGNNPLWYQDSLWTGILLLIVGLIGFLGFWREFWGKPNFWM
jgi:hypothetical protein